jgi:hypothetical protein
LAVAKGIEILVKFDYHHPF